MMRLFRVFSVASLVCCAAGVVIGQSGAVNGEWRSYGADLGNTRYSPLDQVNATNFNKLEVAWRFKTDSLGPRPEFQLEGTPLMVGGLPTQSPARGEPSSRSTRHRLRWMHSEVEGARGARRGSFPAAARVLDRRPRRGSSTSRPATASWRSTRDRRDRPTAGVNGIVT
jgi:hypothetical protein